MNTLQAEEKTFDVLRRIPYEEMVKKLKNDVHQFPPLFNLGDTVFESRKHELVIHYQKIRLLEAHGWTLETFVMESERRAVLAAIDQFNESITFPETLIERAKEFFPNARFTEAKIELE